MKAKATFLSYISAEKRLRKEQLKANSAKKNTALGEQVSQLEKRASMSAGN
ncbi:hypothetical protein ACFSC6_08810 [Rufibacter sediminis]|uniref:Uncharacterized protein n=1 Tax=Rufibacter sediminis TaxID=2762756 RepID=A0ABR6VY30_9BACT|nr:hypothetical protein [Rufibacter sediminis]MBC3542008.1 hypothetical protein [Rufibacter sediminis]